MKRFWLVLLSLGLVLAFSASAMAVDVKFSGSFYVAGMYQDRTTFMKDTASDGPSTAFYFQRLRLQTDFVVSPGLKLVTRLDALERVWGAPRYTPGASLTSTNASAANNDMYSAGTTAENENIAIDYAYVEYASPIGVFRVGYQGDGTWGTPFGDFDLPVGKVFYFVPVGPAVLGAYLAKFKDSSYTAKSAPTYAADRDIDMYCAFGVFNWTGGSAGLLWKMYRNAATRSSSFEQIEHFLLPYAKVQIGPVKVQAEVIYGFGDYMKTESGVGNVKLDNLAGWVDATVDLGIVYFGGSVIYVAGDDPTTTDKKEGGVITGGSDFNPALILFNFDRYYWAGPIKGYGGAGGSNTQNPNMNDNPFLSNNDAGITNAWMLQGRVGVRPIAPLDIMASVTWSVVDKKFVNDSPFGGASYAVPNGNYGTEVDLTATYKITNNLSYMLGVGYLFTGDYFKGADPTASNNVRDDYLVINKLTLTF